MAVVVLESEWLHALLLPLLTHDDAVRLAVVALDARFDTLWHALMYDRSPIAPIQPRELLPIAIESGWWHIVALLQRSSRPLRHPRRSSNVYAASSDKALALCQWIHRHHPIRFDKEAMYAAVRRGCLEEVQWLGCIADYDVNIALQDAAEACHLHVIEWLLRNNRQRYDVMRHANAIAWYDLEEKVSFCAMEGHGSLPPYQNSKRYPLINWAAQRGDLSFLERLYTDGNVCTSEAFTAAVKRGDVKMMQWLHENTTEHLVTIDREYETAAEANQVAALDWLHRNSISPGFLPMAIHAATRNGHCDAIRWLFEHFGEDIARPHYLLQVAWCGNLDLLRFGCHERGCQMSFRTIEAAASRGHYEAVRWMIASDEVLLQEVKKNAMAMLNSSVKGGSLQLVKWCVEDLGTWSRDAFRRAVRGNASVLDFLHTKAKERAEAFGTTIRDQFDLSRINALRSYFAKADEETVCWLLEHIAEEDEAMRGGDVEHFMLFYQSPSRPQPSWGFMRKLLECRPQFCGQVPIFPRLAIKVGSLSDLKMLKAINHPDLFTKKSLDRILASRDDNVVQWFVEECGFVNLKTHFYRIVGWTARYGAVKLLTVLLEWHKEALASGVEAFLKFFGSVIWSAIQHDQASVLSWVDRQDHSPELARHLWTKRVVKLASERAKWRCLLWLQEHGKVA